MSNINEYQRQVSPELPKGPSPFQLIAGFHPPDTQVSDAVSKGIGDLGGRIEELAIKLNAADQNTEVARARADYFSKMKDWTNNVDKSDIDPKEYRQEFDRQSNAIAGDISKGFRYADSHDQFSIWRTEQDVPLLGETLQKQLTVMNDRFGASLQKDLELVRNDPSYQVTALTNVTNAETSRAINHTQAETMRENIFKLAEGAQVMKEGEKLGSAAMVERLQNMSVYTHLNEEDRKKLVSDLVFNENVKQQGLVEEDKKLETHYADVLLKAQTPKDIYAALDELKGNQFHNGDSTYQWQQRFRQALNPGGKDWDSAAPDPVVYDQWATFKTSVRFGRRLPNDPAYGPYAGQLVGPRDAVTWIVDRKFQLGSTYRTEREAIDDLENTKYQEVDQKLQDLFKSPEFKKRYGSDPAKAFQAQGDITDRIHNFIDKENPDKQRLFAQMYAYTLQPTNAITEDVPTTAQGAQLGAQLWNGALPNWKDKGQLQAKVESLANAQRVKVEQYFGRAHVSIRKLSATPTAPGQEGFLTGDNGTTIFYLRDAKGDTQTYTFLPEKYDPDKPVGQRYSGDLTLKQYVGGKWVEPIAPKARTTEPMGTVSETQIAKWDAAAITNKILALKNEREKQERSLQEYRDIIAGNIQGFDPMAARDGQATVEKALQGIDQDLENLNAALKQRRGR